MVGKQVGLWSKKFQTRLRGLWSLVLSRKLNLRICVCVCQCLLVSVCLRAATRSAFPAELSLALSKSSVDPYSVLGKRNQENIAAMAAEIEMLQGEVATARAEANEMKIRATEADEMAKMEKMRRESEEKLRLDATEREKKVYQQWVDEHEVRKEAEINLEKMTQDHSRAENKVKSLMDENNRLSTEQSQFKAKIAKLENEARESTAKAWTMDDQNKKLTQSLSAHRRSSRRQRMSMKIY